MKHFSVFAFLFVILALFSGCANQDSPTPSPVPPSPTAITKVWDNPDELFAEVQAALSQTPCTSAQISASMLFNVFYGESENIRMNSTTETAVSVSLNPPSSHSEITSKSTVGSVEDSAVTEIYMVTEGDSIASYTHSNGIWLKDDEPAVKETVISCASELYASASPVFDLSYADYEGNEVYCLEGTISGADVRPILVSVFPDMGYDSAELSQAHADMLLMVDKRTLLPIIQSISFYDMGEPIETAYSQVGIDVALQSCSLKQSFLSYESAPEIRLPNGAKEKAEAWGRLADGNPVNGDGSYTIREGSVVADIVPPKGFTVDTVAYHSVTLSSKQDITLRYTLLCLENSDPLSDEIAATVKAYVNAGFEVERTDGEYASHNLNFTTCTLKTPTDKSVSEQYYAWAPLIADDDYIYYVLVEFINGYDSAGQPITTKSEISEASVKRALDAVSLGKLMQ